MNVGRWIIGGTVAGVVGAAAWAGITYASHKEFAWIALGIGALVGPGVRFGAGDDGGSSPGMTAVIIALLSIVVGKLIAVVLLAASLDIEGQMPVTTNDLVADLARDVVKERAAKGKRVAWPPGKSADTAENLADYPADVRQEATLRWQKLGADEQNRRVAEQKKETAALASEYRAELRGEVFQKSFGPINLLWFGLAALSAFKIGSGFSWNN